MARSRKMRLSDAAVARLRPRDKEYAVRDAQVPGLGVRVRPSGWRGWIYTGPGSGGRRVSLGPTALKSVAAARRECYELALAGAAGGSGGERESARDVPTFAAFVGGPWREACWERCKPSTRRMTDIVLNAQLLPAFGRLPLDRITRRQVTKWFDAYSLQAPGGANRALDILVQIMEHAVALGLVEANPARGIRRNPGRKLTRFLSREEIRRLHATLAACEAERPSRRDSADIIRLLLFTGCRRGEIMRLRWSEVDTERKALMLADTKTGPRTVRLPDAALAVLERQPRTGSEWVFPSPIDPERPRRSDALRLWDLVRRRAGFEDVRLHDLRHTFASQAVRRGVPLPVVALLLGHKNVSMTLRYAHVGDREVEAAAERIGAAVARLLAGGRRRGRDLSDNAASRISRQERGFAGNAARGSPRDCRRRSMGFPTETP